MEEALNAAAQRTPFTPDDQARLGQVLHDAVDQVTREGQLDARQL
jgi:hypothetical protein